MQRKDNICIALYKSLYTIYEYGYRSYANVAKNDSIFAADADVAAVILWIFANKPKERRRAHMNKKKAQRVAVNIYQLKMNHCWADLQNSYHTFEYWMPHLCINVWYFCVVWSFTVCVCVFVCSVDDSVFVCLCIACKHKKTALFARAQTDNEHSQKHFSHSLGLVVCVDSLQKPFAERVAKINVYKKATTKPNTKATRTPNNKIHTHARRTIKRRKTMFNIVNTLRHTKVIASVRSLQFNLKSVYSHANEVRLGAASNTFHTAI